MYSTNTNTSLLTSFLLLLISHSCTFSHLSAHTHTLQHHYLSVIQCNKAPVTSSLLQCRHRTAAIDFCLSAVRQQPDCHVSQNLEWKMLEAQEWCFLLHCRMCKRKIRSALNILLVLFSDVLCVLLSHWRWTCTENDAQISTRHRKVFLWSRLKTAPLPSTLLCLQFFQKPTTVRL